MERKKLVAPGSPSGTVIKAGAQPPLVRSAAQEDEGQNKDKDKMETKNETRCFECGKMRKEHAKRRFCERLTEKEKGKGKGRGSKEKQEWRSGDWKWVKKDSKKRYARARLL